MRWAIAAIELYWLIWFFVIGIEAFMQRAAGLKSPFDVLEFHHAYIGAAFVALGFWLHTVTGIFVQLLGVVFTVDDLIQHAIQTYSDDTGYQSPLHQLFAQTLWKLPFMPKLVEYLDARWWALVLLGGLAILALGCRSTSLVPMVRRPDTRAIGGVLIDSSLGRRTGEIFDRWLPKENAVCFYGALADTLVDGHHVRFIRILNVRPSQIDSSSEEHVFFPRDPVTGCSGVGLLGWGHSHPGITTAWMPCTHSPLDLEVTAHDPRLLIGIVFCADGRGEILFQDARRYAIRWAERKETPP